MCLLRRNPRRSRQGGCQLVCDEQENNNNLDQIQDHTVCTDPPPPVSINTQDEWDIWTPVDHSKYEEVEEEWEDWDDWDSLPPKPKEEPKKMSDTEFRELVRETVGVERAMELRLLESVMGKSVYYNLNEPESEDEDEEEEDSAAFIYPWQNKYRVFKPRGVFA